MTFEERIDEAVEGMFAANVNRRRPSANVRLAPDARINDMVATLEALRPRQRTWERILLRA